MLPFVSVIVPVYNGARYVRECLASLLAQDYPQDRHELLIVDNGSTDGTWDLVGTSPVRRLSCRQPRGCGAARNAGIRQARGELLAFTDIDCVAESSWLRELVTGWEDGRYGGFVGMVRPHPSTNPLERWMAEFYDQEANLRVNAFPFAQTNNVAYRRRLFEAFGGFDEGLRWYQDVELGWRMDTQTAYRYRWNPGAVVLHRNRTTLAGVGDKFFCRGYGRSAAAKRVPALRRPPIPWLVARHGGMACAQAAKAAARCVPGLAASSDPEARLRPQFWLHFHAGMAAGLAAGWCDWRNAQVKIPQVNGHGI